MGLITQTSCNNYKTNIAVQQTPRLRGSKTSSPQARSLSPAAGNWSLYLLLDHLDRCISSGNHGEHNMGAATEKGREVTNKEHTSHTHTHTTHLTHTQHTSHTQ